MKRSNDRGGERGERKKEKKMQHQQQQQQLPEEIETEILLRLPVKSLVRFKCVCKSWFSLISDPLFATSHFNLITAAPTHSQRLIYTTMHATETRSIDFQASLNDPTVAASMNLDFLIPQSDLNLKIGGSCRGFIFFHSHWDLYLWNPSTRIHKQIPASPILSGLYTSFFTFLYGFGYDPSTDDYLVVLGTTDVSLTATDDSTDFKFFSLRANTWKEIKGAPYYMNAYDSPGVGTFFNGAIHWLTYRDFSVKVIIAFDLTERRISETPLPDTSDIFSAPINGDLWVFGGLMSLWGMDNDIFEIWVTKEYSRSVFILDQDFCYLC